MTGILENFLPTVPLFVKLYGMALLFTAFMSLIVWKSKDHEIAELAFFMVAFLSLIPVLGIHSYFKEYKVLFYLISIFCSILWILTSLICLIKGLLALALIGFPFLLMRLLFNEPLDSYFLVLSCLGGLLSISIIAACIFPGNLFDIKL